jgi:hypothetical protein
MEVSAAATEPTVVQEKATTVEIQRVTEELEMAGCFQIDRATQEKATAIRDRKRHPVEDGSLEISRMSALDSESIHKTDRSSTDRSSKDWD